MGTGGNRHPCDDFTGQAPWTPVLRSDGSMDPVRDRVGSGPGHGAVLFLRRAVDRGKGSRPLLAVAGAHRPTPPCSWGSWPVCTGHGAVRISCRPKSRGIGSQAHGDRVTSRGGSCPLHTGICHGVDRTCLPRTPDLSTESILGEPEDTEPSCAVDRPMVRHGPRYTSMSIVGWCGVDRTMAPCGSHRGSVRTP
jgi:hypothetical protein